VLIAVDFPGVFDSPPPPHKGSGVACHLAALLVLVVLSGRIG